MIAMSLVLAMHLFRSSIRAANCRGSRPIRRQPISS